MVRAIKLLLGATVLFAAGAAQAADVKVTGIHNCCGQCAKAIQTALTGAGATDVVCKPTEVTFTCPDGDKAVKALFAAGYSGKVEGAKAPEAEGVKGLKEKTLKITGIHNCCGNCTRVLGEILKPYGTADVKPRAEVITVTSDSPIDAEALMKSLRDAGFSAKIAK